MNPSGFIGAGPKENRQEADFYPTPPEATQALVDWMRLSQASSLMVIWEPACGEGQISKVIEATGHNVLSTDLRNTGYGIGGVNFLTRKLHCDAIITNPPFALAEAFIRHALEITPTVAMLVKAQFWHAAKRYALFQQHPPAYILPITWRLDFLGQGQPMMDCAWNVWLPGVTETRYQPLRRPATQAGFDFEEEEEES